MLNGVNPVVIILWFIVFLFSLSFHESAHALVSDRFGDDTGRLLGRITLNPVVHIDPVGTIIFPLLGALFGIPLFGWAKPVPVNPLNWREKDKANICVSAAGPLSNLLLALVFFGLLKGALRLGFVTANFQANSFYELFTGPGFWAPLAIVLWVAVVLNISLAIFNLFPVPPLDGSHVLESMLPYDARRGYEQLRPYGFLLLYGLFFLGVFSAVLNPVITFVARSLLA